MLLLSWAGHPLQFSLKPENKTEMLRQANDAFGALHKLKVLQMDAEVRNMLWDGKKLMVIDFERAVAVGNVAVEKRKQLGMIPDNRKRKQPTGDEKVCERDVTFDDETYAAKGAIFKLFE